MANTFLQRAQPVVLPFWNDGLFWIFHLHDIQEQEITDATRFLNEDSLQKVYKLIAKNHQFKATITYALMRFLLGKMLGKDPHTLNILRTEFGKPYLAEYPIHFNLSHSGEYAFLGVHPCCPIGVDIERIENNWDSINASQMFKNPVDSLIAIPPCQNRGQTLCSLWCAKESYLKATGSGFAVNQMPYLQQKDSPSPCIAIYMINGSLIYAYHNLVNGYVVAVCTR